MVLADMCLDLGCSELLGLQWQDFDWENLRVHVQRAVVHGRVGDVKTEYRNDYLPLDPALAEVFLNWRRRSQYTAGADWVFASPFQAGRMPYLAWGVQQRRLKPAALRAGLGTIGWHTLRHTYRAWLDATGAQIGVQQKLMRHSDIRTTMNIYGDAMEEPKRQANSRVVRMVLA